LLLSIGRAYFELDSAVLAVRSACNAGNVRSSERTLLPGAETYKVYVVRSCSDSFILDKYACCVQCSRRSRTFAYFCCVLLPPIDDPADPYIRFNINTLRPVSAYI
jgi:hypothetical protein